MNDNEKSLVKDLVKTMIKNGVDLSQKHCNHLGNVRGRR